MSDDSDVRAVQRRVPVEPAGRPVEPGCIVRVLSVASCARELPEEDQVRLRHIVGQLRPVAKIDGFGFVWLSFDEGCARDDLCLMAAEVEVT